MAQRSVQELSAEECSARLAGEVVGRLVYMGEDGPTAVPVNYALDGEAIVFRVEQGTKTAVLGGPVAFEVDRIDPAARSGWSVLVRGTCHEVDLEEVPAMLRRMAGHFPAPWAEGPHNTWRSIVPGMVTGRQLGEAFSAPLI